MFVIWRLISTDFDSQMTIGPSGKQRSRYAFLLLETYQVNDVRNKANSNSSHVLSTALIYNSAISCCLLEMTMKRNIVGVTLSSLVFALSIGAFTTGFAPQPAFAKAIHWYKQYQPALKAAKEERKWVLV